MTTHPDHRNESDKLAVLWKECITLWRNLVLGFGYPLDLMRWGRMRALEHRALGHWLRDLEALVRRAITSDALTRTVPPPRLHQRKRTDKRNTHPASPEDMPRFRASDRTDPTTWRVTFHMSRREYDPTRKRSPRRSPPNLDPEARRPCRGYAFRIEALRRAIQYREAYVMRYARRIARLDEAASVNNPIELPDPPPRDPPDRRLIHLNTTVVDGPRANPIETPPWTAKYAEPG
jgi:hypothetical protein